jgi:hypothetical protein
VAGTAASLDLAEPPVDNAERTAVRIGWRGQERAMDAITFIQRQIAGTWHLWEAILHDLSDAQLNWTPSGTVDSIGIILVHLLADDDFYIQTLLQGQPRLWETAGWGDRLGLTTPPVNDQGWGEIRRTPLTVGPVLGYAHAVRAATDTYLTALSVADLDHQITVDGSERLIADVLAALVRHTMLHLGEIAALKGMQGATGLPF